METETQGNQKIIEITDGDAKAKGQKRRIVRFCRQNMLPGRCRSDIYIETWIERRRIARDRMSDEIS